MRNLLNINDMAVKINKETEERYDQLVYALLRGGYDVCEEYIGNVHTTSDGAYIYVKYRKQKENV